MIIRILKIGRLLSLIARVLLRKNPIHSTKSISFTEGDKSAISQQSLSDIYNNGEGLVYIHKCILSSMHYNFVDIVLRERRKAMLKRAENFLSNKRKNKISKRKEKIPIS